jgi:hypothetical protein
MSSIQLIGNNLLIMGSIFLSGFKPNYITIAKLIPTGTTNKHGLMLSFSKTPNEAIPSYFILITQSILQNYQIGSINGGITLVVLLNSFTHRKGKEISPNAYVLFQILGALGMLMVL